MFSVCLCPIKTVLGLNGLKVVLEVYTLSLNGLVIIMISIILKSVSILLNTYILKMSLFFFERGEGGGGVTVIKIEWPMQFCCTRVAIKSPLLI